MGPTLYIIHRMSPYYEAMEITRQGGLATIHNCLWYIYGALLQQGDTLLFILMFNVHNFIIIIFILTSTSFTTFTKTQEKSIFSKAIKTSFCD